MTAETQDPYIYLLPFAGGGAADMKKLRIELEKKYKTICLELPGRGRRWREPFLINSDDAVKDLCSQVEPHAKDMVIVGHSLGAYLGYKVACYFSKYFSINFVALSNIAPSANNKIVGNVSLKSSCDQIRELAGYYEPLEKLRNYDEKVYSLAMTVLKYDLLLSEYFLKYSDKPMLPCNIHLVYGLDEGYSKDEINEWGLLTGRNLYTYPIEGDHFFPQRYPERTASIICSILEKAEVYCSHL